MGYTPALQWHAIFHQDGIVKSVQVPGWGEYHYGESMLRKFTTIIPEMFKIKDGNIHRIEATMVAIPHRAGSGWEDE